MSDPTVTLDVATGAVTLAAVAAGRALGVRDKPLGSYAWLATAAAIYDPGGLDLAVPAGQYLIVHVRLVLGVPAVDWVEVVDGAELDRRFYQVSSG